MPGDCGVDVGVLGSAAAGGLLASFGAAILRLALLFQQLWVARDDFSRVFGRCAPNAVCEGKVLGQNVKRRGDGVASS